MVFVRKQRRLVVHVQPLLLAFAVAWVVGTLLIEKVGVGLILSGALAILILAIVLSLQRIIRRVGDDLEIWTVFGLRRLKVKQVYLCVVSHTGGKGGATIDVELRHGKTFAPLQQSTMVSTHLALGLATPIRVAKQIADALDMPEPQLAPWLSPPSEDNASAKSLLRPKFSWRRWQWPAAILALCVVSILATSYSESGYAELFMRCSRPHQVRMSPIGLFTVPRSGSYKLEPGMTRVEIWDNGRRCWVRQEVVLALRVRTVLDLDELASHVACVSTASPPK
jgi:hypothetical protein